MELVPYISQIILYVVVLLVFVLFVSFILARNKPDKLFEHPEKIAQKRRYIRTYIEQTSREMTRGELYGTKRNFRVTVYNKPQKNTAPQRTSIRTNLRSGKELSNSTRTQNSEPRFTIVNEIINKQFDNEVTPYTGIRKYQSEARSYIN